MKKLYEQKTTIEKALKKYKTRWNVLKQKIETDSFSWDDYKKVLERIQDEKSKYIYYYKVMSDCTNDPYYQLKLEEMMFLDIPLSSIRDMNMKYFIQFLLSDDNYKKEIYVLGFNEELIQLIQHQDREKSLDIRGIYDAIEKEEEYYYEGIPVISLKRELNIRKEGIAIVGTPEFFNLGEELKEHGIATYLPIAEYEDGMGLQYFGEPFLTPKKDEVYIDGGASNFYTIQSFLMWSQNSYKKVYAFEPNKDDFKKCSKYKEEFLLDKIEIFQQALWKEEQELPFAELEYGASAIRGNGKDRVKGVKLDQVLKGQKATLIKLNIEGTEYEALQGAEKTIKKYKPRMMISAYHLSNDILTLALYILNLNPEYKIYIRHYNFTIYETMLYFV